MAELIGINRFPLTGARAEALETANISLTGMVGSRELVIYDELLDPSQTDNRLSQKQLPLLATLTASYKDELSDPEEYPDDTDEIGRVIVEFPSETQIWSHPDMQDTSCFVREFGDLTPCTFDSGDDIAPEGMFTITETLRWYLGHPSLRLARKKPSWLAGQHIEPAMRANSPLHIVTESSVNDLRAKADDPQFGVERFRADFVLGGDFAPHEEQAWIGKVLRIGEALIMLHRGTKRCPVPGYDQETGENKKDVPKLYGHLPKAPDNKKPLFGVYGYPILNNGELAAMSLGNEVSLLDSTR